MIINMYLLPLCPLDDHQHVPELDDTPGPETLHAVRAARVIEKGAQWVEPHTNLVIWRRGKDLGHEVREKCITRPTGVT